MMISGATEAGPIWALGLFRTMTDDIGAVSEGDGEHNITGRLAWAPVLSDSGDKLVHVGIAHSIRKPPGDVVNFASRPEVHMAHKLVDTGDIMSDGVSLSGLERASVHGSLSFQGEYVMADVDALAGDDSTFTTLYVQGSYFLTGEHRA